LLNLLKKTSTTETLEMITDENNEPFADHNNRCEYIKRHYSNLYTLDGAVGGI
jgi:hypothetical protein